MSGPRAISIALAAALFLAAAVAARASSFLDPRLHFRTIETEHFLIYFHAGEDRLAARLAAIAEEVWPKVGQALDVTAPRRTHVMLVDQSESANGWATPFPYNTIFITASAPAGYEFLGHQSDWLRLVFIHEFTHIVHLDRSRGWARLFRGAFGRSPIAFPNSWLPRWQLEGLAAWQESQLTGEGRQSAGDFRAIETLQPAMPLHRANGGMTRWPGGLTPYAYGLGFHEYLGERFGGATFGALAESTAGRLPFWGAPSFRKIYGEPLGALWHDYEASIPGRAASAAVDAAAFDAAPKPVQLTSDGFTAAAPRFFPPACDGCAREIIYSRRNPDELPALYAVPFSPSGGGTSQTPRRLTTRYLGSTHAVDRSLVVFDQQEMRRNAGLYSDLYLFDRQAAKTRALTHEARLQEPDLSPDGQTIAAVRQANGTRELVIVRLSISVRNPGAYDAVEPTGIKTLISAAGTDFNTPRWSPDGTSLVVARQQSGAFSDIVIVDAASGTVRQTASLAHSRIVTPTWTPDGARIIAAAAADAQTFQLYEFDAAHLNAPPRQLTFTTGGAFWPDVSDDGRLVTFAGQTAAGFDIFLIPYERSGAVSATVAPQDDRRPLTPEADVTSRTYRPVGTLAPTSWFPLLEADESHTRVGAAISGNDVLRRHLYAASATWLIDGPDDAFTPDRGVPDWDVSYVYDRWRPTFFFSASSETLFAAGPAGSNGRPSNITLREREAEAGAFISAQHVRSTHRALLSAVIATDRVVGPGDLMNGTRAAVRLGASTSTAHEFGYSISRERGVNAGMTAEFVRRGLGASADATTVTADFRAYLPAFGRHDVVAVRAGAGTTSGPAGVRRTFLLGGADNAGDVMDFSRDALGLLRGFSANTFAGSHIALINVDYRVPLLRPERGFGTWPLFLQTIHAAGFGDVGHAWSDTFRAGDLKTSFGAELAFDLVAGYALPVTLALGAGRGHDGAAGIDHNVFYARLSRSF